MKNNFFYSFICCFTLLIVGCNVEPVGEDQLPAIYELNLKAGAIQVSGPSYYADPADCDFIGAGADFALILSGDLEGCLYVFVEEYNCSPSGTYKESGKELFIGTYNGEQGSFMTNYKFEAKFEGCEDGLYEGAEIFGRCQHPIIKNSGTGVFEGVSGRLDFKDDVEKQEFPYRGHLRF